MHYIVNTIVAILLHSGRAESKESANSGAVTSRCLEGGGATSTTRSPTAGGAVTYVILSLMRCMLIMWNPSDSIASSTRLVLRPCACRESCRMSHDLVDDCGTQSTGPVY